MNQVSSSGSRVDPRSHAMEAESLPVAALADAPSSSSTASDAPQVEVVSYLTFDEMQLSEQLVRGIYGYGFEKPSVIQQQAIVPLAQGRDVIATAQSGTGKTGSFTIGTLAVVDPDLNAVQALIIEPTHELASQTLDVLTKIGDYLRIRTQLCVGGRSMSDDVRAVRNSAQVVVGTPGRVCALLEMGALRSDKMKIFVMDEADKLLSEGFEDSIRFMFQRIPQTCQVGIFSATMPPAALELTQNFMKNPVRIIILTEETALRGIRQFYVDVGYEDHKLDTMLDLFTEVSIAQCVIFCNSRRKAEWLAKTLDEKEYSVSLLHGDLPSDSREKLMDDFRIGRTRVLITTDLLARGIDVQGVSCVLNFDLTSSLETYIHRIGRAGRFGRKGIAINLVSQKDAHFLKQIQRYYSTEIQELPQDFASYM
jgi:translation initiation factor 4A